MTENNAFTQGLESLIETIVRKILSDMCIEPNERLISIEEAAQFIGLSKATIYTKSSHREIPFHKIPGSKKLRFSKSELLAWQKSKQRTKKI